jgi:hypothetical protein
MEQEYDEVEREYLRAIARSRDDPDKAQEFTVALREYRDNFKIG